MITKALLTFVILWTSAFPALAESNSSQPENPDEHIWLGREPKDMPTLISNFRKSCERRYLPDFEKKIKPFDKADAWNRDHCICIARFFIAKNLPKMVQVVNLELRGALKTLPPLPNNMAIFLDSFELQQQDCARDPRYVSQAEVELRADKEIEARERQNKGALKPGAKKPKLPTRPQKTPQSMHDSEARE